MRIDEAGSGAVGAGGSHDFEAWDARLRLTLRAQRGGTQLVHAEHVGPLRVQRPFHPEGHDGPCHVYVLHPPGGVVGGDRLRVEAQVEPAARALLTMPGATKLYRARGAHTATLVQQLHVDGDGLLEWLPHETIVYDGARAHVRSEIALAPEASYAGWEIVCLGRPAAGERFTTGSLRTELAIRRGGQLVYLERGRFEGGDAVLEAPWGLSGMPVFGSFVVASPRLEAGWVEAVREAIADDEGTFAATRVSGALVLRFVGGTTRAARRLFERAWAVLRPLYAGRPAVHPRIWST